MNEDMQKRRHGYDYYNLGGNVGFQGLFPETDFYFFLRVTGDWQ